MAKIDKPTGWQFNKYGNYTDEEFKELCNKPDNEIKEFLRHLKITNIPCPPKGLITQDCFNCGLCFKIALDSMKSKLKKRR